MLVVRKDYHLRLLGELRERPKAGAGAFVIPVDKYIVCDKREPARWSEATYWTCGHPT